MENGLRTYGIGIIIDGIGIIIDGIGIKIRWDMYEE